MKGTKNYYGSETVSSYSPNIKNLEVSTGEFVNLDAHNVATS